MAAEIVAVIIIVGILIKLARVFGWFIKCLMCFGFCKKKVTKRLDKSDAYQNVIMRGGKKGRSQASGVKSVVVPMRRTSSRGELVRATSRGDGDDLHYIVVNSDAEGDLENEYEYLESLNRGKRVQFLGNTKWAV